MENIRFWCRKCHMDVETHAYTRKMNRIIGRVKEGLCPICGATLRRFPDATWFDKYYKLSRGARIQARAHAVDTLQRNDPLFDIYYPEHARKEAEELEAKEKKAWQRKKELGY